MNDFDREDKYLLKPQYSDFVIPTNQSKSTLKSRKIWYVILSVYAILLSFTGSVTFFYNHDFAAREENIKKLELMKTSEQFNLYKTLLTMETENMKNVNKIANQAFNVVLGSLLGFLAATFTNETSENDESSETQNTDF